jgi:hypothetical protein
VPVLTAIFPEVKRARCMSEPFPTDNKKNFHLDPTGIASPFTSLPVHGCALDGRYGSRGRLVR